MTELRLRGLSKRFGKVAALTGIDLTAATGTRTAIVGPSGSGKTTLLRLIAGFEPPDAGEICLDGALVANPSAAVPPHRRNIGLVMQEGALFPHLSVIENIRFGVRSRDGMDQALELLDLVELGRSMAARRPHELSGGQQQRVALARALVRQPRLMLLDEPFSALDAGLREQMRKATAEILAAAGTTTILVTHDQAEAMEFADQIAVLRGGILRQAGRPRDVYLAPVDRETAEFLGPVIILDAVIIDGVAVCSLGHVRVVGGHAGPTTIMLRPEQIVLQTPEPDESPETAVLCVIRAVDFAGPSVRLTLEIRARPESSASPHISTLVLSVPARTLRAGSMLKLTVVGDAHALED